MRLKDLLLSMANDTHLTSYVTTWQTGHYSFYKLMRQTSYADKTEEKAEDTRTIVINGWTYVGPSKFIGHSYNANGIGKRSTFGQWIGQKDGVPLTSLKTEWVMFYWGSQTKVPYVWTELANARRSYDSHNTSVITFKEVE